LIDSFYTPSGLADRLVNHISERKVNKVIDFCIGDGDLIKAAIKKFPNAEYFGTDISTNAIIKLRQLYPKWTLDSCDFLNHESRQKSKALKNGALYDLILLNPPFSCFGGTIHEIKLDNKIFRVSTAMRFLVESIKYLNNEGALYAIMPISSAYSQKDKKIWDYLQSNYVLKIIEEPNSYFFKGCSPTVILISINDKLITSALSNNQNISLNGYKYLPFRGKVSTYEIKPNIDGEYFVHTTNLKNNRIENLTVKINKANTVINGPAVLIPRVGKPNPQKICVIAENSTYALSDCIIALKTKTIFEAEEIKRLLLNNWESFFDLYKGTGARYISLDRLNAFFGLKSIDFSYNIGSIYSI
jgi:hypothetical protein